MKRFLIFLMALMLVLGGCLSGLSEGGQPAAPEGFGPSEGGPGGMTFPEGMTPPEGFDGFGPSEGGPGGMTPPEGGFSGAPFGGFGGGQGRAEGQLGSWSMGGTDAGSVEGADYAYDAALHISSDGVNAETSAAERIASGSYDDTAASGIVISDSVSGHNGVIVENAAYTITGAAIDLLTDADGTDTCDFSGKGTAVAAFGKEADVVLENSTVHTAGVATMPIFADDGAVLTVKNSTLRSDGGTLYKEYLSTPDQKLMVAPPWILGIMGTSRCLNLMGTGTTVNVIDSDTSAGAWAVLSTDSGTDMVLNVCNSSLTLNNADESSAAPLQAEGGQITETLDNPYTVRYGSGYGSFVIGSAVETFAGAEVNVGTYAAIMNGGTATYTALEAGETYELKNSAGDVTAVYEAGEDKASAIHSDTFGFMAMQNANRITLEKGTVVDSGYATFLVKTGYGGETLTARIDSAEISNGGVLIQLMDNDDATNGGMMSADDAMNTNGGMQNFIPFHREAEGFRTEAAKADAAVQTFEFTNGAYSGNIYNASGSDGLNGSALYVTFGEGAQYEGAAASTSAIHVKYEGSAAVRENGGFALGDAETAAEFARKYQNTLFTINEYWSMGQVANLVCDNGANAVHVTLADDAVWQVTGTSLLATLTIEENAKVIVPEGIALTVGGTVYTDCVLTADSL